MTAAAHVRPMHVGRPPASHRPYSVDPSRVYGGGRRPEPDPVYDAAELARWNARQRAARWEYEATEATLDRLELVPSP